jgi:enediyne biosynthesis protein E3
MEESAVLRNMQMIEDTFREVQELFPTLSEEELVARLESYPLQFRSIAYEAASMQYVLDDLKAGNNLLSWSRFFNQYGIRHSTQCDIGAGWAFAQQQINPSGFFRFVQGDLNLSVLDGYGYYEGMFRRRKSVLSQQQPDFLDELTTPSYYRGLGRSLWYSSKGEIEQVAKVVSGFPDVHQPDLWTGLGTAVAYVGGCEVSMLEEVAVLSGVYKANLWQGACNALKSREVASSVTDDVLLTVRVWDIAGVS